MRLMLEAYPFLKAADDLLGRKTLLGKLQMLLSPVQHALVDGRPQLHLHHMAALSVSSEQPS